MYLVHNTGQIHQFFNEPKNCIFAYNSDRMRVYFCSWILVYIYTQSEEIDNVIWSFFNG
jgi:hypothetical protein